MKRAELLVGLMVSAAAFLAPAQVLSPVAGGLTPGETRRTYVVTLTRRGFEPPALDVKPGKVTLLVRDLAATLHSGLQLRDGSKTGALVDSKARAEMWQQMRELQFTLSPGTYYLGVADARDRALKITVNAK